MAAPAPDSDPTPQSHHLIKLNVGGKLFQTTASTLQLAGPDSLLAALSNRHSDDPSDDPIFIDRDPEIFSVLLSLLRSPRLPSTALLLFSPHDLLDESLYYGLDSLLRSALSPPPLSAVDATLITTVLPSADPLPSSISPSPVDGSLLIAHAGQISSYDWTLAHSATVRTHLDSITSLRLLLSPDTAALGSLHSPGLHFYDVSAARHLGSVHWADPSDPRVYKARVTSIATTAGPILAAFECPHRENCILAVDGSTLQISAEIGRQSGSSIRLAAPTKLADIPALGAVFAATVSSGAFGFSGYMKLWDLRSGKGVWETSEPGGGGRRFGDSFADVDVDVEEMKIFKVCSKSGDVGVADIRMLGEDPWVYLEERSVGLRSAGGGGDSMLHCYEKQLFVSRESGLEAWSQVENDEGDGGTASYRRYFVDREEDARRGPIVRMEGGGDRLFVCRDGMEGVEVWESSNLAGAISLL